MAGVSHFKSVTERKHIYFYFFLSFPVRIKPLLYFCAHCHQEPGQSCLFLSHPQPNSILPTVEGPCSALISGYVLPVTLPRLLLPSLIDPHHCCPPDLYLMALFVSASFPRCWAAAEHFSVEFFHGKKGAQWWCYRDSSEPWLMQLHLKSNWKALVSCLVAYEISIDSLLF